MLETAMASVAVAAPFAKPAYRAGYRGMARLDAWGWLA
jgi:hypothetical protein